nr:unnamed protein product [Fasciola hepatica]
MEKIYGDVYHSPFTTATLAFATVTCNAHVVGSLIRISNERWQYFTRWINCWLLLFNVLFIVNCVLNLTGQHSPACGALTVFVMFMSWMNILLQMLHYRSIAQVKHWVIRPPLAFNRRKPHTVELKFALTKLNKDLARIKRRMAYMESVLDQTVEQTGMGSYKTQQDVGIYSDDPVIKD